MKTNYLPKDLPFLPGNSYADPKLTSYHKTQLLGIQDGVITGTYSYKLYLEHGSELPITSIFDANFYNLFFS